MVSSIVGIAVVALPAEVITGGYIDVIKDKNAMMLYDGRKRYE